MAYTLATFCFLAAGIGWFLSWCFGTSEMAAFTIPCVHNGWNRHEKAAAILRAVYYYLALGLFFLIKDLISSYMTNGRYLFTQKYSRLDRLDLDAETAMHSVFGRHGAYEAAVYAPLVLKYKGVRVSQSGLGVLSNQEETSDHQEVPIRPSDYGGTDLEMRTISSRRK